jgi:hypothetical protein
LRPSSHFGSFYPLYIGVFHKLFKVYPQAVENFVDKVVNMLQIVVLFLKGVALRGCPRITLGRDGLRRAHKG